jgi:hypothetical protein
VVAQSTIYPESRILHCLHSLHVLEAGHTNSDPLQGCWQLFASWGNTGSFLIRMMCWISGGGWVGKIVDGATFERRDIGFYVYIVQVSFQSSVFFIMIPCP